MIRRTRRAAAVLLGCLLASYVSAQTPSPAPDSQPPKKIYTHASQFRLPFNLDEADRGRIRDVLLFVKAGDDAWRQQDTAAPTQAHFSFRAPRDGEYAFSVVVVDNAGNATPADVTRQPPSLIVVVDTQRPEIEVRESPTPGTGPWFRCQVSDANPDPTTVRLEYERPDGSWRPLEPVADGREVFAFPGKQEWPDEREWTGRVRATVADRAGNSTTRDFAFKPRAGFTSSRVENRVEKPVSPALTTQEPASTAAPRTASSVPREFVNSTHLALAYRVDQLGPSGVGKVEVWLTRDAGQTWTRACEDSGKCNTVEFDVPGEATYGVVLVASNGNGVGDPPPVRGDAPDLWVEVDTTRPTAAFGGVRRGVGADAGCLIFTYEAHDKNLGAEPISLYSAPRREGPWTPIARGLKNDGVYRWPVPRDAGSELYFRLEVLDLAGNITRVDLPERTVLDQARPRARVLGVTAGSARGIPPGLD